MVSDVSRRDESKTTSTHGDYRAVVDRYEDEPNQCTIYTADDGDDCERTAWIRARAPYFLDIRAHR
jgi:hypothetical protein